MILLIVPPGKKKLLNMNREIVICHAVDTEGPLFESLDAKFERLQEIFGVDIKDRSMQKFNAILDGAIDVGIEPANIKSVFSNHLTNYNDNWEKIDNMLNEIYSTQFRNKYVDSYGRSWRITWHCLDHIGYTINPRKRDIGYHNIFDHYMYWMQNNSEFSDDIEWHFHPPSIFNEAHRCASLIFRNDNIYQILNRKIIDRNWFPTSYRAGFHTERPDMHWFLEQWIPFDLSNISQAGDKRFNALDMQDGRSGDWRRAPWNWGIYQPSHDDYQREGNCRRYIGRVLNVFNRLASINKPEVEYAFRIAQKSSNPVLVGITGHDFRDLRKEIDFVYNLIQESRKNYPDVKIRFETTRDAFRRCLWPKESLPNPIELNVELERRNREYILKVKCVSGNLFGPQPFLSIKTVGEKYIHDNFDFQEDSWTYVFNDHTVPFNIVDTFGVASNDRYGNTSIITKKVIEEDKNDRPNTN